ncbi:MAG: hypothetical protein GYA16_10365 [Spirochaetes bacterium]|nr:hypothetical protein [Spirochaetota bacterium]
MVKDNTCINYNSSSIDNGIIDVAVTDDNHIYVLSFKISSGIDYYLYYLSNPGSYSQILNIGHASAVIYFKMEALDNEHLINATNGLSSGYNGLFIYNVEKRKIEKFITTKDTIALYVPRF